MVHVCEFHVHLKSNNQTILINQCIIVLKLFTRQQHELHAPLTPNPQQRLDPDISYTEAEELYILPSSW